MRVFLHPHASPLCRLGRTASSLVPFLRRRTEPAPLSAGWKLLLSDVSGRTLRRRPGAWGGPRPPTPHLSPHRLPLRSSPACRVPPGVTSFRAVPGQGQGPDVSRRACTSSSFLNGCRGRDVMKTASHSRAYFLAQGVIRTSPFFVPISVRSSAAPFPVSPTLPTQKQQKE